MTETPPVYKKAKRLGLNRIIPFIRALTGFKRFWLRRFWGMDLHPTAHVSMSAKLDLTFPAGVHVDAHSWIAFEARIMTHDRTRGLYVHTRIGKNCFIGGRSMILPGVQIGDNCVIGAGSVVTKSVPQFSLVAGNPARVLREGIEVGQYGRFLTADAAESALAEAGLA
jgi:acetyltransferase-like isoleucine patch superfamily enzyme